MMHTMTNAIAFVDESVVLAIDSRGTFLSNADKRKKRNLFRK